MKLNTCFRLNKLKAFTQIRNFSTVTVRTVADTKHLLLLWLISVLNKCEHLSHLNDFYNAMILSIYWSDFHKTRPSWPWLSSMY